METCHLCITVCMSLILVSDFWITTLFFVLRLRSQVPVIQLGSTFRIYINTVTVAKEIHNFAYQKPKRPENRSRAF